MFDTETPHPRVLDIAEDDFDTSAELHAHIASVLDFPAYYGGNLSALADCLEDIDTPTQIRVKRCSPAKRREWLDGFCTVMQRSARFNPMLEVSVEDVDAEHATLDDILSRLEAIERRLDVIQIPPAVAPAVAPAPTVGKGETCRNLASGSDGDRFKCGTCGCRVSDYLEETRQLIDGLKYCPQCGREVANPQGSNALGWVGELI